MKLVSILLAASVVIILVSQSVYNTLPSYLYQTVALLFLGTAGLYFFLIDVKRQRPEYFVQLYLATLFVKILAYGAYVLFIVWDDTVQATQNALLFMVTYFVFTGVEIFFLYRKVSR